MGEKKLPTLKVLKKYPDAKAPFKPKTNTDAGYDICSYKLVKLYPNYSGNNPLDTEERLRERFIESGKFYLEHGERCLIDTGVVVTVEEGWEIQVRPRSGLALKQGLSLVNCIGTIDCEFRDVCGVILINHSDTRQIITLGDPIAQIVPKRVEHLEVEIVTSLPETTRGKDGYGSTDEERKKTKVDVNKPILNVSL